MTFSHWKLSLAPVVSSTVAGPEYPSDGKLLQSCPVISLFGSFFICTHLMVGGAAAGAEAASDEAKACEGPSAVAMARASPAAPAVSSGGIT
ncbi:hypothetical protein [Streptomyces sp. NPDC096030]|uniref:hypothetical protein n=1 Tax=Streptomyces sp. NPDC096030 TaxID=3155423 RepID=UPI00333488B8